MIALALLFVGGILYGTYYIAGLSQRTEVLKQYISEKQVIFKQAESLQKVAVSAVDQKVKIASYFVPEGNAVGFISDLEKTAAKFGLEYSTQNIDQQNSDELNSQGKELLRMTFSVKGSWSAVMRLLKAIETLPYGLRIDKIDIDTSPDAPPVALAAPSEDGSVPPAVLNANTGKANRWSAIIMFSAVKTKDNAR